MNVLISGGSRGIGYGIAERLTQEERIHTIGIIGKNEENLEIAKAKLNAIGGYSKIYGYLCDLTNKTENETVGKKVLEEMGFVDVLINNAGIYKTGNMMDEADGSLEDLLNHNLMSAYYLTRTIAKPMIEARNGTIINMGSVAGLKAYEHGASYSISKFAMHGFNQNLRAELMPFKIRVMNLMPGAVYTDSWCASGINPGRIMEVQDIADLVHTTLFLSKAACVEDIIIRPTAGDL